MEYGIEKDKNINQEKNGTISCIDHEDYNTVEYWKVKVNDDFEELHS